MNNNLKSRLRAKFSYIYCILSHKASTSGYCLREKRSINKLPVGFAAYPGRAKACLRHRERRMFFPKVYTILPNITWFECNVMYWRINIRRGRCGLLVIWTVVVQTRLIDDRFDIKYRTRAHHLCRAYTSKYCLQCQWKDEGVARRTGSTVSWKMPRGCNWQTADTQTGRQTDRHREPVI